MVAMKAVLKAPNSLHEYNIQPTSALEAFCAVGHDTT
jgi:hypothetical protein